MELWRKILIGFLFVILAGYVSIIVMCIFEYIDVKKDYYNRYIKPYEKIKHS